MKWDLEISFYQKWNPSDEKRITPIDYTKKKCMYYVGFKRLHGFNTSTLLQFSIRSCMLLARASSTSHDAPKVDQFL